MTYHDLVSASCNSLHTWANYVFIPFEIIVIKPCFSLYTDPFKFDVPSPDDVVYTGLRSSKTGLKGMLPSTNNLPLELKLEKMCLIVERATNHHCGSLQYFPKTFNPFPHNMFPTSCSISICFLLKLCPWITLEKISNF